MIILRLNQLFLKLKKFEIESFYNGKMKKKIQKPAKLHSAFIKCRSEDAIFSCWDFGKPEKGTIAVRKQVRKF